MKAGLRKIAALAALGLIFGGGLHARGRGEPGISDLTVYSVRGPSGVGLARLFEEPPEIDGFNVRMEALAHFDLIAVRFIAGGANFGVLPPNVAARIAASGRDIRVAAVIGTGMLSLLTSDPDVASVADLRGRTVEVAGQGSTPDFVFRRILSYHGLEAGTDVTLGFALALPELAQTLIAGLTPTALLPEPFASMALAGRPDLRQVADIQELWAAAGGQRDYPMTLLVVDGAFADANPAAVAAVLSAARASIEWVNSDPAAAGALVERHGLGLSAPVVSASVPRSNFVFIPATDARPSLEALLQVFYDYAPSAIGGAMPADSFFLRWE
ncbi:MAG: ABC transporter substrate-binding protein [Spirochaetes bacterium]|nr:ABC transporter substrate-binding protein [Spirochaetota bacterium]